MWCVCVSVLTTQSDTSFPWCAPLWVFWLVLLALVLLWPFQNYKKKKTENLDTHVLVTFELFWCIIGWVSIHRKFSWLLGKIISSFLDTSVVLLVCVCEQWANYNMPFQYGATASLMPHWLIQDWEKELVVFFQSGLPRISLCLRASVSVCVLLKTTPLCFLLCWWWWRYLTVPISLPVLLLSR